MNDIEVLEKMCNEIINGDNVNLFETLTPFEIAQAIENLLKERQSDKERIKDLEEMLKNRIKYTNELEKDLFENASNYVVPKSLIKEKIEEYKEELERDKICIDFAIEYEKDIKLIAQIQVLEELLKGE